MGNYKLNGYRLEFVAENVKTFRKKSASRRLYVDMKTKNTGEEAYGYLSEVYPVKSYDKGLGWGDFTMIFDNESDRNSAYNDMLGAIDAYRNVTGTTTSTVNGGGSYSGNASGVALPGTTATKNRDWTTYLVIGAAAVVILMLLWDRKKK